MVALLTTAKTELIRTLIWNEGLNARLFVVNVANCGGECIRLHFSSLIYTSVHVTFVDISVVLQVLDGLIINICFKKTFVVSNCIYTSLYWGSTIVSGLQNLLIQCSNDCPYLIQSPTMYYWFRTHCWYSSSTCTSLCIQSLVSDIESAMDYTHIHKEGFSCLSASEVCVCVWGEALDELLHVKYINT